MLHLLLANIDIYLSIPKVIFLIFFLMDPATTEIYTLSLHDALPILRALCAPRRCKVVSERRRRPFLSREDRKSTRLNSSHQIISYAVFCLKKKKNKKSHTTKCRRTFDNLQYNKQYTRCNEDRCYQYK